MELAQLTGVLEDVVKAATSIAEVHGMTYDPEQPANVQYEEKTGELVVTVRFKG